ncbi:MAG: PilN domain-containing protein [Candidatus Omnitrophota bacterium]
MKNKRVNLIPAEARILSFRGVIKRYFMRSRFHSLAGLVVFILVFIYVFQLFSSVRYSLRISLQKKNIKKLEVELASVKEKQKAFRKEKELVDDENKNIQKRLTFLEEAKGEAIQWSQVLLRLSKLTPADLWISKVYLGKDAITLDGTTLDNAKVSGFMAGLDASGFFKDTSFNFTQKKEKKGAGTLINFEVTTHLNH